MGMTDVDADVLWQELMAICEKAAVASGGSVRIARNEKDASPDPDPEAQEHLKINGNRVGRDFRLYGFMAELGGPQQAIADFATVLLALKTRAPAAFDAIRADVDALDRHFSEPHRARWRALWQEPSE